MKNNRPKIFFGKKICIICEGYEEYEYFERLISLNVFNDIYKIELENAKGNGNLVERYQYFYSNDSFDLVLIFCDTDNKPSETYYDIKKKIDNFHDEDVSDKVIIFGNPCTMQIMLSHFGEVSLTSHKKWENSPTIELMTGISNYSARRNQRNELNLLINKTNYKLMKKNVSKLSKKDYIIPSTNILMYLESLESKDTDWIDEINFLL